MVPYLSVPVFPHNCYQALNRSLLNEQLTLTHILYFCCTCTYCHPLSMGLYLIYSSLFSSVQSLSPVQLCPTPWTAVRQASLSITNSQSLLKVMSIMSVMPSNHLILCHLLLFLLAGTVPSWLLTKTEPAFYPISVSPQI